MTRPACDKEAQFTEDAELQRRRDRAAVSKDACATVGIEVGMYGTDIAADWPVPRAPQQALHPPSICDDCGDGSGRSWLEAALPHDLAAFVATTALSNELSPESVLAVTLPVIGLAIGPDVIVCGNGEHRETMSFWSLSVAPPSARKSAAFQLATAPLLPLARRVSEAGRRALAEWRSRESVRSRERAALEKKLVGHFAANNAKGGASIEALRARLADVEKGSLADPEPGIAELWSSNATPEAVVERVGWNRRFAALSAEGATILEGVAEYRDSGNDGAPVGHWCALESGDPLSTTRKGRVSITIAPKSVILCAGITVQPDVLLGAMGNRVLARRGFLPRWFKFWPAPIEYSGELIPVNTAAVDRWHAIIEKLASGGPATLTEVRCTREAAALLRRFELEMRRRVSDEADLGTTAGLAEWAGKGHGRVLRLACFWHAIEGKAYGDPIDAATMQSAILLVRYGLAVEVALASGDRSSRQDRQCRLLAHILRARQTEVRPWEVVHRGWCGFRKTEDALAALRDLAERDCLREESRRSPDGGRPSVVFLVSPRFQQQNLPERTEETENTRMARRVFAVLSVFSGINPKDDDTGVVL